MEWTKAIQSSSINDLANFPAGFMENALIGFVTSNIVTYVVIGLVIYCVAKLMKARRSRTAVQAPLELQITNISQNRRKRQKRQPSTIKADRSAEE